MTDISTLNPNSRCYGSFSNCRKKRSLIPQENQHRSLIHTMSVPMRSFAEVWSQKVREGYEYGPDALEQVAFGWNLAMAEITKLQKECDNYSKALTEIREQFELLGWD